MNEQTLQAGIGYLEKLLRLLKEEQVTVRAAAATAAAATAATALDVPRALERGSVRTVNKANVSGTCLQGYVDVSYARLVEVFGPPGRAVSDGYKIDAVWVLEFADGTVATIYNYKDGPNYMGDDGTPVTSIRDWHIGGHEKRTVELVTQLLTAED